MKVQKWKKLISQKSASHTLIIYAQASQSAASAVKETGRQHFSIFLQYGIPAIAVTSKWFIENMSDQDVTHTPKDNPSIVDCSKVENIAFALDMLIRKL